MQSRHLLIPTNALEAARALFDVVRTEEPLAQSEEGLLSQAVIEFVRCANALITLATWLAGRPSQN